ncbi:MAG: hypothetical protein LBB85_10980 [Dysgonamonadaceae bacterium]|jgi:hypothetical protein|nr:hypothetical protein [Dysgonamonadaceae bacterium]
MSSTKKRISLREIGIITGGAFIAAIICLCLYNYVAGVLLPNDDLQINNWAFGIILFVSSLFRAYFVLWRVNNSIKNNKKLLSINFEII